MPTRETGRAFSEPSYPLPFAGFFVGELTMEKLLLDRSIIISQSDIRRMLSSDYYCEAMAVLSYLLYTQLNDGTMCVICPVEEISSALRMSIPKVRKGRKVLLANGIIEDVAIRDNRGIIVKHCVLINNQYTTR